MGEQNDSGKDKAGISRRRLIAGGVAANQEMRSGIARMAASLGTPLVAPPGSLCTDNGAIIAWAGAERLARGMTDTLDASPRARWPLTPAEPQPGEPS